MAQGQEDSNGGFVIAIGVMVAMFLIWYFFGQKIAAIYLWWKWGEMKLLEWTGVPFLFADQWNARILPILDYFKPRDVDEPYTFADLQYVGNSIGYFSRWYFAALLSFLGYKAMKKNPLSKFRRVFSMKMLVESEKRLWPAICPVAKLNLVGESVEKGPWAMAKRPLEFSRYYKLLDDGNKLNRDRTEKLFAAQLGKLWEGPNRLPPYARALFAIFAAQACGNLKGAKAGLDLLSVSMGDGSPDYSFVDELLKAHGNDPVVKDAVLKHGYVFTVMATMLEKARGFGVLSSGQFIWLRPLNRQLWYTLNGVGRRVAFAEVAGIYAHWIAEKIADHAIERPYVIKAVDGLERALMEVKFD